MDNVELKPIPCLISCKPLKPEFEDVQKIFITSDEFTLGRGINNQVDIPYLSISRRHCTFKKLKGSEWIIEDNSTFGIEINGKKLGKGSKAQLSNDDIISLEPCDEFIYRFVISPSQNDFVVPKKRIRMLDNNIVQNVKIKFEESQNFELKHIEQKIQNTQQILSTSKDIKHQVELDMNRKIQQLETSYAQQIENLKGEKVEVEKQKLLLIQERDAQLCSVREEMEQKITELKEQIEKHNETESVLLAENSSLKEKLLKEREEFLGELSRENSSKQGMLEKLEAKIQDQEELQLKERKEFEELLKKETEQLRITKEKELKELAEEKRQREVELQKELDDIKKNMQEQVEHTDQQRRKAEQQLNEHMELMKKNNDLEKDKMDKLIQEKEVMQKKLSEVQEISEKTHKELKILATVKELELTVLTAERSKQQAEHVSEIEKLKQQLEKVKNQLQNAEKENSSLIQNIGAFDQKGDDGSTKETVLTEVGELMESELQCSICAELFVEATTLNCSHTFCKYCITKWKNTKKECPVCRTRITTECKSLVLDSFIEKMVQNLTQEMKVRREEMLKSRQELMINLIQHIEGENRGGSNDSDTSSYSEFEGSEGEEIDDVQNLNNGADSRTYSQLGRVISTDTDNESEIDTDDELFAYGTDTSSSGH